MIEEHRYWIQVASIVLIGAGAILLIEHINTWGGSDLKFGHEWGGLLMVLLGVILSIFSRKK